MATIFVNQTQGTLNLNHGDQAFINECVAIDGDIVMGGNGGGSEVLSVNGTVDGHIFDTGSSAASDRISIGTTGSVLDANGNGAIMLNGGGNVVNNAGLILSSFNVAIAFFSNLGNSNGVREVVVNTGTIESGDGDAIAVNSPSGLALTNSGTIIGSVGVGQNSSPGAWTITNSGSLLGSVGLGAGNDKIVNTGTISGDIFLGDGSNVLDSRYGTITGTITGGNGGNKILAGAGDDTITTGSGNDTINGGAGADTMSGGGGNDVYIVDNAGDVVTDTGGIDTIDSYVSFDLNSANGIIESLVLRGSGAIGGTGTDNNDTIRGEAANNVISGEGGNDTLFGGAGADTIFGGAGNDSLDGGRGADSMVGGAGDDTYFVDNAGDVVSEAGGSGADFLQSTVSFNLSDTAHCKGIVENLILLGSDAINGTGNGVANLIDGNSANNVIDGKGGNDTIDLSFGGSDAVVFSTALSAANNVDTVTGFTHGNDKIDLNHTIFVGLAVGALSSANFALNTATTADQHIIYNTTTGALFYDPDGNGAAAAIQFALLTGNPGINETDFVVI